MDPYVEVFGMPFKEHWDTVVMPRVLRRERICKHPPLCPKCGTNNIQLRTPMLPAHWKCMVCKHPFIFEPLIGE